MSAITPDIVKQVALLARLRLDGEDLARVTAQLDGILEYAKSLQAVPTDGVEPTSHVLPLSNVLRADEPRPSLSPDAVTAMAPAKQPPFVKVPKVIES